MSRNIIAIFFFQQEVAISFRTETSHISSVLTHEKRNIGTGFPKKGAGFSKIKNIPYLLSDKKGKTLKNIDF